ncbi:Alpha/Beta hydrolase protein [Apiosordaria backusii]|uniref:Alpha/Beta hydrolase protein n=1 Tax=Apiosordaria backusii TaxID=314023 RepID=A0AA40EH49_9PEZI|nr:Alpha/Beta hydrolase protein [Apiosordaria backusii]
MILPPRLRTALLALTAASALAEPTVTIAKTKITYRGTTAGSIEHFQNIKYAHDTSGHRRFAPPEAYVPPEGSEIDASTPGPACPQNRAGIPPFFVETPNISEDCLSLRISRPAGTTADDKLPVVVHLHGGGVVKGSAYDPHYDPDNLLTLSGSLKKPVIYVALNYRITIFGFARLPILKDQKSMNVGMRDQLAGFQWIKDNIAAFGGDPDKITSFGLSAGGTFTSLLLTSYGGERGVPFNQGWCMSGPPGTGLNITSDVTELHTREVAKNLGCTSADDSEILQCLREVPFEKLAEKAVEYAAGNHPPLGLFTFIPSVDGDLIPDRQTTLYKAGKFVRGIPLVYGWTQDDGALSTGPAPTYQSEDDMKDTIRGVAHALTDEDYKKLFSLYPESDFAEEVADYEARKAESDPTVGVHYFRVARILRDLQFTCSSIDFGNEMLKESKRLDPKYPGVHLYTLNQTMLTSIFAGAGMPYIGASHGSDLNYLFNLFPEGKITEEDQKLSRAFIGSFINFAYTGKPSPDDEERNGETLGRWPEAFGVYGPESVNLLVIGGPWGTGSTQLTAHNEKKGEGLKQMPINGDNIQVGEMTVRTCKERRRQLKREKLFERCQYINSLSEKLGN